MPVALLAAALLAAPVFPATTPAQVIALATRPTATAYVASYDVVDRTAGATMRYRVTVARRGARALFRADLGREGGVQWLGLTGAPGGAYACVADPARGQGPECGADPFGVALVLALMAPVGVDEDAFRPLARRGGVVRQRRHLGRAVSCLYAETDRRQLCVVKSGVGTVMFARGRTAVATSLRLTATARDVRPPARIQPAED